MAKNSPTDRFPLYVVVEHETECETPLADGTCYLVDLEMDIDGRTGDEAVMAWNVDDTPWPNVMQDEPGLDTLVLAATKIVQDETEVIRVIADSSCFYDSDNRAVYPMTMSVKCERFSDFSEVPYRSVAVCRSNANLARDVRGETPRWRHAYPPFGRGAALGKDQNRPLPTDLVSVPCSKRRKQLYQDGISKHSISGTAAIESPSDIRNRPRKWI